MAENVTARKALKTHLVTFGLIKNVTSRVRAIDNVEGLRLDPGLALHVLELVQAEINAHSASKGKLDAPEIASSVLKDIFDLTEDESVLVRGQISFIQDQAIAKLPSLWRRIKKTLGRLLR